MKKIKILTLLFAIILVSNVESMAQTITGELKKWHKVTLTFDGPNTNEQADPNPFTYYKMDVTFTGPSGQVYSVPGYFAADGDAANTSATEGDKWRCHIAPDEIGEWSYSASFRKGEDVVFNSAADAGETDSFDGTTGTFTIDATDKTGRDHRGKGRLTYVGKHYLQFAETGEYFLKQGADAPENLLAYNDFDGTTNKTWAPHIKDWKEGDPTWGDDKGKGLIGAINYLASEGLNVFSFITMNIQGDDKNVFPYPSDNLSDRLKIDVSKTAQWEIVFEHADKIGMYLHFKTLERENDKLLSNGNVGDERILYYRELIARFSHHLALNWNLGEETTLSTEQVKANAKFVHETDPYNHNIVIHTWPGEYYRYSDLIGDQSELTGASIQGGREDFSDTPGIVSEWVKKSAAIGKPWIVAVDEPGDHKYSIRPDSDPGQSHHNGRKNAIWGALMKGGAGCEYYFGYEKEHSDLSCQDWRSRDNWWDYCRYALEFFNNNSIPFWDMIEDDSKTSEGWCFMKENNTYIVYFPNGISSAELTVSKGTYTIAWYNPRTGGSLQKGSVTKIEGEGKHSLGLPAEDENEDWVCLVQIKPDHSIPGRIESEAYSSQQGVEVLDINEITSVITNIDNADKVKYTIEALVGETFELNMKVSDPVVGTKILLSINEFIIDTILIESLADTLSTSVYIEKGIQDLELTFENTTTENDLLNIDWIDLYGPTKFFEIAASASEGGQIIPDGVVKVKDGDAFEFTFDWEIGYKQDSLLVDGSKIARSSSFIFENVTENHEIFANFSSCIGSIPTSFVQVNDEGFTQVSVTTVVELDKVDLKVEYDDAGSYYWMDKDGEMSTDEIFSIAEIAYSQSGIYSAIQTNSEGCKGKSDFDIQVDYVQLDVYEAEDWTNSSGLETENCTDIGGGDYIASIENNDWSSYNVTIEESAIYNFTFRMANITDGGFIIVSKGEDNLAAIPVKAVSNAEQDWLTTAATEVYLEEGIYDLKFTYKGNSGSLFNFNWFNIEFNSYVAVPTKLGNSESLFNCYPNPVNNLFFIDGESEISSIEVLNAKGEKLLVTCGLNNSIDLSELNTGIYFVKIYSKNSVQVEKILKK